MENIKDIWSQKQISKKVLSISGIIWSLSVIVLAGIQILGVWETAINVLEPLLGVLMFI